MSKSHFNDEFLVLLGPIISRFFACSNEKKNKPKQQRMCALVLSLCLDVGNWDIRSLLFRFCLRIQKSNKNEIRDRNETKIVQRQ
jgi:hypothetical protein